MKTKTQINGKNNSNFKLSKKSGNINIINNNSLSKIFFNQYNNRYKISDILDFLDINEQLPLIKLNSIISNIIINKYNLPFKSVLPLRQYKNKKNIFESKYSNLVTYFKNIININNIEKQEYQYIISFLLKNMNNNFIIFDKLNDDIKIFFEFLSKIKYIKNINHIKFKLSNCDEVLEQNNLNINISFINFFINIKKLEVDTIEKSFYFFNKLINFDNNSINSIEKINLSNISVRFIDEILLNYDDYNSLLIPKLTNLKYIFLTKINLSISFLNEIISNNLNLIKLVINNCSNNNISTEEEKEKTELTNKNINNCKNITHIEFNKNNFSDYFTNEIIKNIIALFFNANYNIYIISCGFNHENNLEDIYTHLNEFSNTLINTEKYLNIKFSPSFIYHINKNKRTIEVSNYLKNIEQIKQIKYDKIKLCLYNTDNPSIPYNIKKAMDNYYKKNNSIKDFQIFATFKSGEFNQVINLNNNYLSIIKFTLYFQNEEDNITLFGNKIIFSIILFFPNIKVISFKNINFQNDDKRFNEYLDDLKISIELMLFGKKEEIVKSNKNKKIILEQIKFSNCYYYNNAINKYILKEIGKDIYSYLGKEIKLIYMD